MTTFTLHLPSEGDAARARIVGDGGALALLLPPVFLATHRLWFALAVYLLAAAAIAVLGARTGAGPALGLLAIAGFHVWLEGGQMQRATLERAGWREVAVIDAGDREEAELRLLARIAGSNGPAAPAVAASRESDAETKGTAAP